MINLYYGPVVNPKSLTHFTALPKSLIAVGSDGNIVWIEDDVDPSVVHNTIALHGLQDSEYHLVDHTSKSCAFIMPGMIDTHVHACQFPNLGVGGDRQLLDWLLETVFPTEAKFEDVTYAKHAYNKVIERSLACGTTTSCYYASLHLDATKKLADIVHAKGQRAFVGKCNMDWNCPGYYIERTPKDSLEATKALIHHIQSLSLSHANEPLVHPIITPRFALSCSDALLTELGELAAAHPHIAIQTHVSENRREVDDARRRFGMSYVEVYDRFGLLRHNTILGHGVWLTDAEMDLIRERGAGVAHCPTSNFYLSSGMARVGEMLDRGVKVGLGTDVGGGYSPSVLYAVQMASTASKMVALQAEIEEERRRERRQRRCCRRHTRCCRRARACCEDLEDDEDDEDEDGRDREEDHHRHCGGGNRRHGVGERERPRTHLHPAQTDADAEVGARRFANRKLDTPALLYLATLGGAHLCALPTRVGSFEVGKAFDALHVSLDDVCGNPGVWGDMVDVAEREPTAHNVGRWLERFLFTGDDRNVRRVWVQGVLVGGVERDSAWAEVSEGDSQV